ncbi:MAG: hypothetical protein NVSMB12_09600 [Acidimicrobiales bacterium]
MVDGKDGITDRPAPLELARPLGAGRSLDCYQLRHARYATGRYERPARESAGPR